MNINSNVRSVKRTIRKYGTFSACIAVPTEYIGKAMNRIIDEDTGVILLCPIGTDPATVENALARIVESAYGTL